MDYKAINSYFLQTSLLSVDRLQSSYPVFLTDALFSSKTPAKIRLFPDDYAAIALDSSIHLWKYKSNITSSKQSSSNTCKTFKLQPGEPVSVELFSLINYDSSAYTAKNSSYLERSSRHIGSNLISTNSVIGACCISKSGQIRYWPKISSNNAETNFLDIHLWKTCSNLSNVSSNDEPLKLINGPTPGVIILITHLGNIFLLDFRSYFKAIQLSITAQFQDFEARIHETRLKFSNKISSPMQQASSPSFLSNFGRRMSSLFAASSTNKTAYSYGLRGNNVDCVLDAHLIEDHKSLKKSSVLLVILTEKYLDFWLIDKETCVEAHLSSTSLTCLLQSTPLQNLTFDSVRSLKFQPLLSDSTKDIQLALLFDVKIGSRISSPIDLLEDDTHCDPISASLRSDSETIFLSVFSINFNNLEDICTHCYSMPLNAEDDEIAKCLNFTSSTRSLEQLEFILPHPNSSNMYPCLLGALVLYTKNSLCLFEILTGNIVGHLDLTGQRQLLGFYGIETPEWNHGTGWGLFTIFTRHLGMYAINPSEVAVSASVTQNDLSTFVNPNNSFNNFEDSIQSTVQNDLSFGLQNTHDSQTSRHLFDQLSRIAKVYCMGFKEQAFKRLLTEISKPECTNSLLSNLPIVLKEWLRLAALISNDLPEHSKRPQILLSFVPSSENEPGAWLKVLMPLVKLSNSEVHSTSLDHRYSAKLKGLHKLAELWLMTNLPNFIPLKNTLSLLCVSCEISASCQNFVGPRFMVLEQDSQLDINLHIDFDVNLLAKDGLSLPAGLGHSLSKTELQQASEDDLQSADGCQDREASLAHCHILSAMLIGCELIEFMRVFQQSLNKDTPNFMESVLETHLNQIGLSNEEEFSYIQIEQMVINSPALIFHIFHGFLNTMSQKKIDLYNLRQALKLLNSGLVEAISYRTRHMLGVRENILERWRQMNPDVSLMKFSPNDVIGYLPCWITDCTPFGIGDVILQFFNMVLEVVCGVSNISDNCSSNNEMQEFVTLGIELAGILLRAGKSRLEWLNSFSVSFVDGQDPSSTEVKALVQHVQRTKRLFFWFSRLRSYLIQSISEKLNRPELALSLATQYVDREQIMRITVQLSPEFSKTNRNKDSPKLDRYLVNALQELPDSFELQKFALNWYLKHGYHGRVQNLLNWLQNNNNQESQASLVHNLAPQKRPSVRPNRMYSEDSTVTKTPKEITHIFEQRAYSDHAWVYELSQRKYFSASIMLEKLGSEEELFIGRKKTLLSLAKLSRISAIVSSGSLQNGSDEIVGDLLAPRLKNIPGLAEVELQASPAQQILESTAKVRRLQVHNASALDEKLAQMSEASKETSDWLKRIDDSLIICSTQMSLPMELVSEVSDVKNVIIPAYQPILKLHLLVDLCMTHAQRLFRQSKQDQIVIDCILKAINCWRVLRNSNNFTEQSVSNTQIKLWTKILLINNWLKPQTNNLAKFIKDSIFYRVCLTLHYNDSIELNKILPDCSILLASHETSPHNQSNLFKHNVQTAYELVSLFEAGTSNLNNSVSLMSIENRNTFTPRRRATAMKA